MYLALCCEPRLSLICDHRSRKRLSSYKDASLDGPASANSGRRPRNCRPASGPLWAGGMRLGERDGSVVVQRCAVTTAYQSAAIERMGVMPPSQGVQFCSRRDVIGPSTVTTLAGDVFPAPGGCPIPSGAVRRGGLCAHPLRRPPPPIQAWRRSRTGARTPWCHPISRTARAPFARECGIARGPGRSGRSGWRSFPGICGPPASRPRGRRTDRFPCSGSWRSTANPTDRPRVRRGMWSERLSS